MKRLGKLLAVCALVMQIAAPTAHAIETAPTAQPLIDGPFMITGYSFSGHTLRYVQVTNNSNEIASLDGWNVSFEWSPGIWVSDSLNGLLPAHKKIIVADPTIVPSATFTFTPPESPADPRASLLKLTPPLGSNFNEHVVVISVSGSTVNVATAPATYYFARNVSGSTGNFLSTFSAFVPGNSLVLEQDELYEPPSTSPLQIVEVYPEAATCSPGSTSLLCSDYVKVQNISDTPIDLSLLRLRVGAAGQSATSNNTIYPNGLLPPAAYAALPIGLTNSGSWVWIEDVYGISLYDDTVVAYPSSSGHAGWSYSYNASNGSWQWTKYPTPYDQENQFASGGVVNQCDGLKLSEIGANYLPQFIEVYNSTPEAIDISGCQLQTNRSQTDSYVFPDNTLLATGGYLAIPIESTNLSLTKTTSGTVYVLSSDGLSEVDARNYEDLDEDTSFALVGGTWLQTFIVTPGSSNSYAAYPPCETGYVRNLESGRCNKIVAEDTLTPCLPTQYRSPETNRCRNVASASALTPCKVGQYRSPETNRCRSLASASSTLKPCAPNQERNPDTNRCRNIVKNINADFPVEAIADAGQGTIGWWAFGGVGMIAAGYAGWEWRREVASIIRKASSFMPLGK